MQPARRTGAYFAQPSSVQPTTAPTGWRGRIEHAVRSVTDGPLAKFKLAEASFHNTLAAGWSLAGEVFKDVHPQFQQGARLLRAEHQQRAALKVQEARDLGAITEPSDIWRLSDLGDYALSLVAQGAAPLVATLAATRAGGVPAAFLTAHTLNTAFNVDHQLRATGEANLHQASAAALPASIVQIAVGGAFPKAAPTAWLPMGAAMGSTTAASQQASTWGAFVDPAYDVNFGRHAFDGAVMGSVLGPFTMGARLTPQFKASNQRALPLNPPMNLANVNGTWLYPTDVSWAGVGPSAGGGSRMPAPMYPAAKPAQATVLHSEAQHTPLTRAASWAKESTALNELPEWKPAASFLFFASRATPAQISALDLNQTSYLLTKLTRALNAHHNISNQPDPGLHLSIQQHVGAIESSLARSLGFKTDVADSLDFLIQHSLQTPAAVNQLLPNGATALSVLEAFKDQVAAQHAKVNTPKNPPPKNSIPTRKPQPAAQPTSWQQKAQTLPDDWLLPGNLMYHASRATPSTVATLTQQQTIYLLREVTRTLNKLNGSALKDPAGLVVKAEKITDAFVNQIGQKLGFNTSVNHALVQLTQRPDAKAPPKEVLDLTPNGQTPVQVLEALRVQLTDSLARSHAVAVRKAPTPRASAQSTTSALEHLRTLGTAPTPVASQVFSPTRLAPAGRSLSRAELNERMSLNAISVLDELLSGNTDLHAIAQTTGLSPIAVETFALHLPYWLGGTSLANINYEGGLQGFMNDVQAIRTARLSSRKSTKQPAPRTLNFTVDPRRALKTLMGLSDAEAKMLWAYVDGGFKVQEIMRMTGMEEKPIWNTVYRVATGIRPGAKRSDLESMLQQLAGPNQTARDLMWDLVSRRHAWAQEQTHLPPLTADALAQASAKLQPVHKRFLAYWAQHKEAGVADLAAAFGISPVTAKDYRTNIYGAFGVGSIGELDLRLPQGLDALLSQWGVALSTPITSK